jgi:hypothetical protein
LLGLQHNLAQKKKEEERNANADRSTKQRQPATAAPSGEFPPHF